MNLYAIKKLPGVYRTLSVLRRISGQLWMRALHGLQGTRPKRVFFSSFKGSAYSDNPRYISEALHRLRPDLEIVWQLNRRVCGAAPDYVRVVPPHSLRALTELTTARCIVDNFNRPIHFLKFPDQLYVQTWHGDRGFKKMLFDLNDGLDYPDGQQMDLAVSGSYFGTRVFRTAFRYDGEVMQAGMPRNDALVRADLRQIAAIRRTLGVDEDVQVMLYAPTFRNASSGFAQKAGFDLVRARETLESATGRRWLILTRAHDQNSGVSGSTGEGIRDVTGYPEMAELLLAADLLITDYSSSAGDYVLLDRPVILYQPDLDPFMASDREMYFDLRRCPYTRAESEAELLALLADFPRLNRDGAPVRRFYGVTETGQSAEAVARWISGHIPR